MNRRPSHIDVGSVYEAELLSTMTADPQSLPLAPPPWTCKCTAYVLPWYNSASSGIPIDIAYSPLEANASSFSSEKDAGKYKGGLCMAQVIRYRETPVGEYDELALLPGCFEGPDGKENDLRITGIWVSSKQSLMNGRNNWNIPKSINTPRRCDLRAQI